jgi:GNAT superfamily N-acetyltransferase
MLYVRTLENTPRGLRDFLDLPYALYKKDPNWVPPIYETLLRSLLGEENPLMSDEHRFFLAYRDNRPVARVLAGVDTRLNQQLNQKRGYISLFESEPSLDSARIVLDAATEYLKQLGMEIVVGPNSPSFNDFSKGLLWEGEEGAPVLFNPYNPPYYNEYFTALGFQKHRDHYAYWMRLSDFPVEECRGLSAMAQKRFQFRVENVYLRQTNLVETATDIAQVIGEAFPPEWELVTPTMEDVLSEMKSLIGYAEPGLMIMAYAGKRPIGVLLALRDYHRLLKPNHGRLFPFGWLSMLFGKKTIHLARFTMMFVSPDYHNKAVSVAMALAAYESAEKLGIEEIEASTIDETNLKSILSTERMGAHKYRTYRQYEKAL